MNPQLERELQTNIQSLKAPELANILSHFQALINTQVATHLNRKGMNYECEMLLAQKYKSRGYGRNPDEATCNATKNLFSKLIGENAKIEEIKQALRFRNGVKEKEKNNQFVIDDISMIQLHSQEDPESDEEAEQRPQKQVIFDKSKKPLICEEQGSEKGQKDQMKCDCIYAEMYKYQQNQLKHLQARINLLAEENSIFKKVLLHGCSAKMSTSKTLAGENKENESSESNSRVEKENFESSYLLCQDSSRFQ